MLACGLDVRITFDIPLTILSAIVAVVFTFAAFMTGQASDTIGRSAPPNMRLGWSRRFKSMFDPLRRRNVPSDPEAGPSTEFSAEERIPILSSTSDQGDEDEEDDDVHRSDNNPEWQRPSHAEPQPEARSSSDSVALGADAATPSIEIGPQLQAYNTLLDDPQANMASNGDDIQHHSPNRFRGLSYVFSFFARNRNRTTSPVVTRSVHANQNQGLSSGRTSEESTPLDSSDDSTVSARRQSVSSSHGQSSSGTLSSTSWSEPLHAGLSREARIRIKAQARDRPIPKFGWKYWLKAYYASMTVYAVVRAAIWGLAIVFMHYCGKSVH